MRKIRIVLSVALALLIGATPAISAEIFFDGEAGTTDWNTATNWSGDLVPTAADEVKALNVPGFGPVISTTGATALSVDVGTWTWAGDLAIVATGDLTVTNSLAVSIDAAGSLTNDGAITADNVLVGAFPGADGYAINNGQIDATGVVNAGHEGDGVLVNNGTINAAGVQIGIMDINGKGELVNSGDINVLGGGWLYVGHKGDGILTVLDGTVSVSDKLEHAADPNGTGHINLYGGTIDTGTWGIVGEPRCTMDVTEGTLIATIADPGGIAYMHGLTNFTAFGGWGTLNIDESVNPGRVTVTATDEAVASSLAHIAWAPEHFPGGNNVWCIPNNWVANVLETGVYLHALPRSGIDEAQIFDVNANGEFPVIPAGAIADANNIIIGDDGEVDNTAGVPTLVVDGGTLTVDATLYVGHAGNANAENVEGKLIVNDGSVTAGAIIVGHIDGVGTLEINGGLVATNILYGAAGANATSSIVVNDGVLSVGTLLGDAVNLTVNGGTVEVAAMDAGIYAAMHVDIAGGELIIPSDSVEGIRWLQSLNAITAYDGNGCLLISYDSVEDETTVTALSATNVADINGDCVVDLGDLAVMAANWLTDVSVE